MQNSISAGVYSFTKKEDYSIIVSCNYIKPNDKVLCIDDFLAYGSAASALGTIVEKAGANVVGMGFVIEKVFQEGGKILREKGYKIESLAQIESLEDGIIKFCD